MTKFTASKVTVLRFTNKIDQHGQLFPPECYCKIPEGRIPVKFNHEGNPVGWATMKRVGNKIVAEIEVTTKMGNTLEALRLMRMLTPSIEARILDAHEHVVTAIQIEGLSLSQGTNADKGVKALGDKVRIDSPSAKAGLH